MLSRPTAVSSPEEAPSGKVVAVPRVTNAQLKRLREQRDRLRRRLVEVDREIRRRERAIGKKAGRRGTRAGSGTLRCPNARRLNEVTVSEAIVRLLREKRKPLHYRDIAERLIQEGRYRTRSRNFLSTVAITIQRDRRIRRVAPGVYGLR